MHLAHVQTISTIGLFGVQTGLETLILVKYMIYHDDEEKESGDLLEGSLGEVFDEEEEEDESGGTETGTGEEEEKAWE